MDWTLVIMAAGLGSRYGGLKQIERLGPQQAALMEFSIFDAVQCGCTQLIVIVNPNNEALVQEQLKSAASRIQTQFVTQRLDDLPEGFCPPKDRKKPWGTGQALWAIRNAAKTPFVIINADDFYGRDAFQCIAQFFKDHSNDANACALVCYELQKTLSDFGTVSRALCAMDSNACLQSIEEHTQIGKSDSAIVSLFNGNSIHLDPKQPVSLNFWAFSPIIFKYLKPLFKQFLDIHHQSLSAEFYLPSIVRTCIETKALQFKALFTQANWFGITYPSDKPTIEQALLIFTQQGVYPERF